MQKLAKFTLLGFLCAFSAPCLAQGWSPWDELFGGSGGLMTTGAGGSPTGRRVSKIELLATNPASRLRPAATSAAVAHGRR